MTSPEEPVIQRAWRVSIVGAYLGQTTINSLGYKESASAPVPTVQRASAIAQAFGDAWESFLLKQQNPDFLLVEAQVFSLQDRSIASSFPQGTRGTKEAVSGINRNLPGFVAANIGWQTGLRGRRFRGRTGLCGLAEDLVDGNNLSSSYRADIQGAAQGFLTELKSITETVGTTTVSVTGDVAVISEKFGLATPVSTVSVKPLLGTRVSRLR